MKDRAEGGGGVVMGCMGQRVKGRGKGRNPALEVRMRIKDGIDENGQSLLFVQTAC